jgi:hypothetical protein
VATSTGKQRRPLYEQIIDEHRDMRERLRALVQAGHEGYDPAEIEAVRRALWAIHRARENAVDKPR